MTPWRAGIKADVERAIRRKEGKMTLDEYCRSPASDRFHGAPEPAKPYCQCASCKEPIYYGDEYYEVFSAKLCAKCIDKCLKEAEL